MLTKEKMGLFWDQDKFPLGEEETGFYHADCLLSVGDDLPGADQGVPEGLTKMMFVGDRVRSDIKSRSTPWAVAQAMPIVFP